jgi:hypothetical protein
VLERLGEEFAITPFPAWLRACAMMFTLALMGFAVFVTIFAAVR